MLQNRKTHPLMFAKKHIVSHSGVLIANMYNLAL